MIKYVNTTNVIISLVFQHYKDKAFISIKKDISNYSFDFKIIFDF